MKCTSIKDFAENLILLSTSSTFLSEVSLQYNNDDEFEDDDG